MNAHAIVISHMRAILLSYKWHVTSFCESTKHWLAYQKWNLLLPSRHFGSLATHHVPNNYGWCQDNYQEVRQLWDVSPWQPRRNTNNYILSSGFLALTSTSAISVRIVLRELFHNNYIDVTWELRRRKSQTIRLFIQKHLWGESSAIG